MHSLIGMALALGAFAPAVRTATTSVDNFAESAQRVTTTIPSRFERSPEHRATQKVNRRRRSAIKSKRGW